MNQPMGLYCDVLLQQLFLLYLLIHQIFNKCCETDKLLVFNYIFVHSAKSDGLHFPKLNDVDMTLKYKDNSAQQH